ncbi:MAG: hypothetical protein GY810_24525 [Aureispira sp.]|nr:hypothetical protein [Aureispira sp.]
MYKKSLKLTTFFAGLLFLAFMVLPDNTYAQGTGGVLGVTSRKIVQKAKTKTRSKIRKKISGVKSTAKNRVKGSKKALGRSMKGGGGYTYVSSEPTLDQLIEDPEAKSEISDRNNKQRFVKLFGEWWAMPSDSELKYRERLKAIKDSLSRIDSAQFRVPRRVYDDSRPMVIFGWHQHWMGDLYKGYDYSLLNVVSYYSYDIDPEYGGATNPEVVQDFVAGDFVTTAQESGTDVLLSISLHGEENIGTFLNQNPLAQRLLIDSLVYLLDTTKANGIEINFEGVTDAYKDDFIKFVQVLSHNLVAARGDTCFIMMSVPAYDPDNVYDLARLEKFVDMFIIMGYNFHESPNGLYKMPVAPLNYNAMAGEYDLRKAVDKYVANIGPLHTDRLILALPYFATKWETQGSDDVLIDYLTYSDVQFDYIMGDYPESTTEFDSSLTTHVWRYKQQTDSTALPVETTIYYDDVKSLRKKYQFLIGSRLGGVGLWALGYDSGFNDLNETLIDEFTTVEIPENEQLVLLKKASSTSQRSGTYALTILFYMSIFMACGFCMALFNVKTRQALFTNGRFRLFYLGFFTLLILILGGYLGLFEGTTSTLMIGVVVGSVLSWLGLRFINNQQAKQP